MIGTLRIVLASVLACTIFGCATPSTPDEKAAAAALWRDFGPTQFNYTTRTRCTVSGNSVKCTSN